MGYSKLVQARWCLPQNQDINTAEGCPQACSHRGAEPTQQRGIYGWPCRTHLRGMRKN